MNQHQHGEQAAGHASHETHGEVSLNRTAVLATLHCLTGCAIGEVLGLVIGTAAGLSNVATVVIAILLAFFFGYGLTMLPLLRTGLALAVVVPLAFASDTFSIAVMEIVDNLVMVWIPGAMDAGLGDFLFWGSLALALAIAFVFAFPVNRYLIKRGQGHAVVHQMHQAGAASAPAPALDVARLAVIGAAAITFTVGIGVVAAWTAGEGDSNDGKHDTQQLLSHRRQ
jgi:hypothetical protein